jgi:hypothetical protein
VLHSLLCYLLLIKFCVEAPSLCNEIWKSCKDMYPFIKDTIQETSEFTSLNYLHLKLLIESITTKTRYVTLRDTSARGSDLFSIATRICWPSKKILSMEEFDKSHSIDSLRTTIFTIANHFITKPIMSDAIKTLLIESKLLEDDSAMLNHRLTNLKIIRDFLTNSKKEFELINSITKSKRSIFGFSLLGNKDLRQDTLDLGNG